MDEYIKIDKYQFFKLYAKGGFDNIDSVNKEGDETLQFPSRIVRFENFRNLGLSSAEDLLLNSTFQKGKVGNLLVLIGANNSGKSNILDGLCKININDRIGQNDRTVLMNFVDVTKKPNVSLVYKEKNKEICYIIDESGKIKKVCNFSNSNNCSKIELNTEKLQADLMQLIDILWNSHSISQSYMLQFFDECGLENIAQLGNSELIFGNINKFIEKLEKFCQETSYSNLKDILTQYFANKKNDLVSLLFQSDNSVNDEICNLPAIPDVIKYRENQLNDNSLNVVIDKDAIRQSPIFNSLFKIIEREGNNKINIDSLIEKYNLFKSSGNNYAVIDSFESNLNEYLSKIIDERFNSFYNEKSYKYHFKLKLDAAGMHLCINRGEKRDPIILSKQSTGFRWFFNFYFNFLMINELKPGDIVVMDEPACNLHPEGQKELRKFIKEFAIKNDVLFIMSTHSPFMIDIDNYDELRITNTKDTGECKIYNSFSVMNFEDENPDKLFPIIEALTIKQNVLYDLDTEVVWVEGITDYNYLTMFKRLFNDEKYNKLAFLPFNGVGNNDNKAKEILEKLIKIKFHKSGILTDGDKAGLVMYKLAEEGKFKNHSYNISKIEEGKFKEIEDLFSQEDKEKFPILKEKKAYGSSDLKIHSKIEDFSLETQNNFRALFDLMIE